MSAFIQLGAIVPSLMGVAAMPSDRGRQYMAEGGFYSRGRLPTDSIGNCTLTLTNVVVGSRIHITPQTDTTNTIDDEVAAATTVVIVIPVYAGGSPLNDLLIRVRKASAALKYQPFETLTTISTTPRSVYIAQVPDLIA